MYVYIIYLDVLLCTKYHYILNRSFLFMAGISGILFIGCWGERGEGRIYWATFWTSWQDVFCIKIPN